LDPATQEQWERLAALWHLVCAEIDERVQRQRQLLESAATTENIERVREIQGEIRGLKTAANIVPQKLNEGGKRARRV